tara:strand:+ start:797 stop:1291 length:495 start_codon:yes stop_codon:yes gene_type:complete
MKTKIKVNYTAKKNTYFFGTRKKDEAKIFIYMSQFNCGWYWSFGYLGNNDEHYHLDNYQNEQVFHKKEDGKYFHGTIKRNKCLYDCLLEDYSLKDNIKQNLWKFCELALSIYKIKDYSEMLHIGGAHMTNNPCSKIIKNNEEYIRINELVLPALFNEFELLLRG